MATELIRKDIKKIRVYKPGKPIEEVKRELKLKKVYKLASNEIPFAPPYIETAIKKELKNIHRYPESNSFLLRKKIASLYKVRESQIIFGNGSDELITLTLRALIEKGDEVIISYPSFLIYELQAKIERAKIVKVPLKNFRYNLDKIAEKITPKTKIIFIANPDNPTGSYLAHSEVESFVKKISKNILLFFDEAYFEFAPSDFPQTLKFLKQRGNIIFTRTFSKAYGLAGLRIGYGITSEEIASAINRVREPFNVNRLAQVAALAALENKSFVEKVVSYINKEKEYLYKEFESLKLNYIKSATNFITVNLNKKVDGLLEYLLKKGIIIRSLSAWGLANFFRITVGKHQENVKFIKYLREYLKIIK